MTTPFSIQELQLVRGSLSSKTDEEIAQILERPIEDIIEVIDGITHGQATERQLEVVRSREEATRKRIRQKPKKVSQPKKRDAPNVAADREAERQAERKKLAERAAAKEKEKRKKLVNLVVVAEGDDFGGGNEVAKIIKERLPNADIRVCILGHIQRGGSPSCLDRLIASRMGYSAVECLIEGRHNVMVGIVNNRMSFTPLEKAVKAKQKINNEWLKIVKILAS